MSDPKDITDEIEAVAAKMAASDGLDWYEQCAYEGDHCIEDPACDSSTCIAANYEDHDPDLARGNYLKWARIALDYSRTRITELEAALLQIEKSTEFSVARFEEIVKERKNRLTWYAVNRLQEACSTVICTAAIQRDARVRTIFAGESAEIDPASSPA